METRHEQIPHLSHLRCQSECDVSIATTWSLPCSVPRKRIPHSQVHSCSTGVQHDASSHVNIGPLCCCVASLGEDLTEGLRQSSTVGPVGCRQFERTRCRWKQGVHVRNISLCGITPLHRSTPCCLQNLTNPIGRGNLQKHDSCTFLMNEKLKPTAEEHATCT